MTNQLRALVTVLILLGCNAAFLHADDAEEKAVKAIEALGATIDRGGQANGKIESIDFRGTKVTDADLKHLKSLKGLQTLFLGGTQVTDAGLKELKELKSLTFLGLAGTQVTAAAVKDLQDALPQCSIVSPVGVGGGGGRRAGRGMIPEAEANAALPKEFQAQIFKISPKSIAFRVERQIGMRFRNDMTLPVAEDVKIFVSRVEGGRKVPEKDQELPEGPANPKIKAAFASGIFALSGNIVLDKTGGKIKEVHIVIPDSVRNPTPLPLKPLTGPDGAADPDALPAHAVARFGSLRFRHAPFGPRSREFSDSSVAVSPDGQFLATCTSDLVQLWNPRTGEKVTKLALDNTGIDNPMTIAGNQEIAFSADGTRLAISRGAGKVRILSDMGRSSQELDFGTRDRNNQSGIVNSRTGPDMRGRGVGRVFQGLTTSYVAFLPDAKQVLVSHQSGPLLRLLDVESGKEIRTFGNNERSPNAIALSPNGRWLALSEGFEAKVTVFEIATGAKHLQLTETSGPCTAVAFSSDSKTIATASANVELWDAASGKRVRNPDASAVPELAENRAARAAQGQAARRGVSIMAKSVHFSPDGTQVVAGYSSWLVLWDSSSGKEIWNLRDSSAETVRFMPDGKELLIVAPSVFRFLEAASGKPLRLYAGHQSGIESVAFAPDGKHLATGTDFEGIRIWETASGKALLASDKSTEPVTGLAYSPRGDILVGALGSNMFVWDLRTGEQRLRLAAHQSPTGAAHNSSDLAISADGARLAYATSFAWACLTNLSDGAELRELPLGDGPLAFIAFSPDQRLVAARFQSSGQLLLGQDGLPQGSPIRIWDFHTGKELKSISTPFAGSNRLVFSPDGRTLINVTGVMTTQGPRVFAMEILSGQQRFPIPAAGAVSLFGQIHTVAFSPDGRRLALAENVDQVAMFHQPPKEYPKHSIRVIDLATGQWSPSLSGHEEDINALAFSPDGKLLASGSSDTTALLWNVAELFPATPAASLSANQRASCWNDLAGEAEPAYRSMWKLANDPQTIDMFRKELKPATALESNQHNQVRNMRAIEVLEWMNTKAARQLLTEVADGFPGAELTLEATRSLARLQTTIALPD